MNEQTRALIDRSKDALRGELDDGWAECVAGFSIDVVKEACFVLSMQIARGLAEKRFASIRTLLARLNKIADVAPPFSGDAAAIEGARLMAAMGLGDFDAQLVHARRLVEAGEGDGYADALARLQAADAFRAQYREELRAERAHALATLSVSAGEAGRRRCHDDPWLRSDECRAF